MNRQEFRQLSFKFLAELEQRLLKEGYTVDTKPQIVQTFPTGHVIRIVNEHYFLYNDGDRANFEYLGVAQ